MSQAPINNSAPNSPFVALTPIHQESLRIDITPSKNRTLDELMLYENISLKKDNFTIIGSKPIKADNNLAHKLVYTRTDNSTNYFNLTGMKILIVKDEKLYSILYTADSLREYTKFLPYLEYMIDSFRIINSTGSKNGTSVFSNIIQPKKFELYTNSTVGIQIRYPHNWWKTEDVDHTNNIISVVFFTPINGPYLIGENFRTSIDVPGTYDADLDYTVNLFWENTFTNSTTWTKTIQEGSYNKQQSRILDIQPKQENLLNYEGNNIQLPINLSTINSPNRYLLIFSTEVAFIKNGHLCYFVDMTNQVTVPPPKFSIITASNSTTIGVWQTKNIEIKVKSFSSIPSYISFSTYSTDLLDVVIQPNELDVPPSAWATAILTIKDKGTGALNEASVPQTIPIIANITFPKRVFLYVLNSTIPIEGGVQMPNNEDSRFTSFTITVFNLLDHFLTFLTSLSGLVPLAGIIGAGIAWFLKRTKQNVAPMFIAKELARLEKLREEAKLSKPEFDGLRNELLNRKKQLSWYDRYRWLFFSAAAATAIAGILHIILVPISMNFNPMVGIFFLISGIVQFIWAVPMLKRWGRIWYYIGIAGTIVLMILWAIARLPSTISEAVPLNLWDVSILFLEVVYVGIATIVATRYDASQANQYIPTAGGD